MYGLRAAAIAVYPMYKGLARLAGMDILGKPQTLDEQMTVLEENWAKYDFFFIHFKYTDSSGEDGNFAAKVKRTEEFDAAVPRIMALKPDVLVVTGDHSTPSMLASHSWHPVPTLLVAKNCRTDALPVVRRERMPPRRAGPVRGQVPDVARPGQRRPAHQIRSVAMTTTRTPRAPSPSACGPASVSATGSAWPRPVTSWRCAGRGRGSRRSFPSNRSAR